MNKITLFCFPYAGGSASIYYSWRKYINDCIELVPVELAGKGKRFNEQVYDNIEDVVDDVYGIVKEKINGPYALLGHSMGSVVAYELAHRIKNSRLTNPNYLFVSGRKPPHIKDEEKIRHLLPDDEFKKEIIDMGGTPKDVFENKELEDLFLPIIRNDFKLVENYKYIKKPPLDIETIVFYGDEEEIDDDEAKQWNIHTNKECSVFKMKGDHFFINDSAKEVVSIINNIINNNYRINISIS